MDPFANLVLLLYRVSDKIHSAKSRIPGHSHRILYSVYSEFLVLYENILSAYNLEKVTYIHTMQTLTSASSRRNHFTTPISTNACGLTWIVNEINRLVTRTISSWTTIYTLILSELLFGCLHTGDTSYISGCKTNYFVAIWLHLLVRRKLLYAVRQGH